MRSDTTRRTCNARLALAAALLMLSAWSVADDTDKKGERTAKPEVGVKDTITPEMVRRISGPPRPDNGAVEIQPGLPAKKCAKEDKGRKDDRDKKPEKTGRRKGHC